jgi:glutathione S-transferase
MLTLYIKPYCPYCSRVIAANETIKAPLTLRDISAIPEAKAELLEKGGKMQTPFLEDIDRGVRMYESDDIITYLHTHYGSGAEPIVPKAGNVCPIE